MNKAKKKNQGRLTRRQFLFSSAVGVGCLSVGLKEALAQAEITRKPLLTEDSLNKLLKGATPQEAQTMANPAKTDLLAFLTKYFTLTPAQTEWVKTMSLAEKQYVQDKINGFLTTSQRFSVKFIQPSSPTKASKLRLISLESYCGPPLEGLCLICLYKETCTGLARLRFLSGY